MADEIIILGSKVDNTGLRDSLNELSAELEKFEREQTNLKLDKLQKELDKVEKEMKDLDKESKDYQATLKKLSVEANRLRTNEDKLKKSLEGAEKATTKADTSTKKLTESTKKADKAGASMFKTFLGANLAANAIGFLSRQTGEFFRGIISSTASFQAFRVSLEAITGSADTANTIISQLQELDLQSAFNLQDLQKQTQTLLAFGFEADSVVDILRRLGDISQGSADKLGSLALAFAQTRAQGVLTGQEANQFINAGFDIFGALEQQTGIAAESFKGNLAKLRIPFEDVQDAIIGATNEGGKFFELQKKINETTVGGAISNLESAIFNLQVAIGEGVNDELIELIRFITELINKLREAPEFFEKNKTEILALTVAVVALGVQFKIAAAGGVANLGVALGQSLAPALARARTLMLALNTAVRTNPIGLLVTAIAAVTSALIIWNNTTSTAIDRQEELSDAQEEAIDSSAKEVRALEELYAQTQDTTLGIEGQTKAALELQSLYPVTLGNYTAEAILAGEAADQINILTASILAASEARALDGKLDRFTSQDLDLRKRQAELEILAAEEARSAGSVGGNSDLFIQSATAGDNDRRNQLQAVKNQRERLAQDNKFFLDRQAQLKKQGLLVQADREAQSKKRLDGIRATSSAVSAESDKSIKAREREAKRLQTLNDQANKFELDQLRKLNDEATKLRFGDVNDSTRLKQQSEQALQRELEILDEKEAKYNRTFVALRKRYNDIAILQLAESEKELAEQRAKFKEDTEASILDLELKGLIDEVNANRLALDKIILRDEALLAQRLTEIRRQATKSEQDFIKAKNSGALGDLARTAGGDVVTSNGTAVLEDIDAEIKSREQLKDIRLTFDILEDNARLQSNTKKRTDALNYFDDSLQILQDYSEDYNAIVSQETFKEISVITQKYRDGKISYQRYQDELKKITDLESKKRLAIVVNALEVEKGKIEEVLKSGFVIEGDVKVKLDDGQLRELRTRLAQIDQEIASSTTDLNTPDNDQSARLGRINELLQAYQQLADAIGNAYNIIADAEQARLDRSIALQEKRVERARRIAEKGNADYLELEEERLRKLQLKREEDARKQLVVNQALATSQAVVAGISAIAKAAIEGGAVNAIAAAGAVIGAIASIYAFSQTLQTPSAEFYEGTEYVSRGNNPRGRDTVPAMLTEGEAVTPVRQNKNYRQTMNAIYHEKIPAGDLNKFVDDYLHNKPTEAVLDTKRLNNAVTVHLQGGAGNTAKMESELQAMRAENAEYQRQILSKPPVQFTIDENGIAIIYQSHIDKKARVRNA